MINMGDNSEIPDRHACILTKTEEKQFLHVILFDFEADLW